MKKLITTITLGLAMIVAYPAQNTGDDIPHHEFYVSAGLLNDNQVFSMVGDFMGTILTLGFLMQPDEYQVLTPSIGYRYWLNNRMGFGLHFAFDKNSVKAIHQSVIDTSSEHEWRIYNRYFYTTAVDFNWNYMNKPACQLYGNAGMGATLVSFSDNKTDDSEAKLKKFFTFNMHVSPIGIRIGKEIAGFAEIGWGYKGFFNAGISVKF